MNTALLAGVNNYKMPGNDLRNCCNDVDSFYTLLTQTVGFSTMKVTTMKNEEATKDNILTWLKIAVAQAHDGDHIVFLFSGHGSQVPDTSRDEEDGMDEIICPYDFDWNGTYIVDDEMHNILSDLPFGATCDVFLDSCHSGTGLREIGDPAPKFIPYPYPIPITSNVKGILQNHDFTNVALWAGCRSDQTSADGGNGIENGAMTWALIHSFYKNGVDDLSRARLHSRVKNLLSASAYDQEPQLECSDEMKNRRVFE